MDRTSPYPKSQKITRALMLLPCTTSFFPPNEKSSNYPNARSETRDKKVDRPYYKTRNTFCGKWYLPHSLVHNEGLFQ